MITVPEYNLKSILYIYIHTIDFIQDVTKQRSVLKVIAIIPQLNLH